MVEKEKQKDLQVDSLIEIKMLAGILLIGLAAFSIYSIYQYVSSNDKNIQRLAYIITIAVIFFLLIVIVLYDFKEHKEMVKGSMKILRDLKKSRPVIYGVLIFDLIIFYIILGIFFNYSASGGNSILGIKYKRHAPPGTSHGEDLRDPQDY
jgi:ABC-type Fe3+ transport system permease subunit